MKKLETVEIITIPNGSCTPFFEIYQCKGTKQKLIYRFEKSRQKVYTTDKDKDIQFDIMDDVKNKLTLTGDIMIKFKSDDMISDTDICRI